MASINLLLLVSCVFLLMHGCYATNPNQHKVQIFPDSNITAKEGSSIRIYCERHYKSTNTDWTYPINSAADKRGVETDISMIEEGTIRNYLEIVNLQFTDAGQYTCSLTNNRTVYDSVNLRVFGSTEKPPEPSISFDDFNVYFNGQNVIMTCYTDAIFTLHWTGPLNSTDQTTNRMVESILVSNNQVQNTLHITNVTALDNGHYTCVSTNRLNQQINTVSQLVDHIYATTGAFIKDAFVKPGKSVQLECTIVSNMSCDVTWFFRSCDWDQKSKFPGYSSCSEWVNIDNIIEEEFNEGSQFSIVEYYPDSAGQVKCLATNADETHEAIANVYVQPLDSELQVTKPTIIFNGNATSVSCYASKYMFRDSVQVLRDGQVLREETDIEIERIDSEYMFEHRIVFTKISPNHSGVYTCSASTYDNDERQVHTSVVVYSQPFFTNETDETEDVALTIVTPLTLECESMDGFPVPVVQWLKNSEPLPSPSSNPYVTTNSTHLVIDRSIEADSGMYACVGINEFGRIAKTFNVKVQNICSPSPGVSIVIVVVAVLFAVVIVFLAIAAFVLNRRKYRVLSR